MSLCRDLGSIGDSQARILDRSSATVKLFDTLIVVLLVFKELILRLREWDIFSFAGQDIVDDGRWSE